MIYNTEFKWNTSLLPLVLVECCSTRCTWLFMCTSRRSHPIRRVIEQRRLVRKSTFDTVQRISGFISPRRRQLTSMSFKRLKMSHTHDDFCRESHLNSTVKRLPVVGSCLSLSAIDGADRGLVAFFFLFPVQLRVVRFGFDRVLLWFWND